MNTDDKKQLFIEFENKKLNDILPELSILRKEVNDINKKKKQDKETIEKLTIEEKKSKVQEKIKKGEKLTTEDLLIFQR